MPAIALTPSTSVVARDAIIATTSSAICTVPMLSSSFNTRFFLSNIPATCQAVQQKVKNAIENMTGLTCSDVEHSVLPV